MIFAFQTTLNESEFHEWELSRRSHDSFARNPRGQLEEGDQSHRGNQAAGSKGKTHILRESSLKIIF